ncbi:hypothetical protein EV127DRAFT_517660 [Xylaria flabelliformis]|nr:hypothetical protein EV127DRAFT_517660 [Xylaria flabelliformis]
MSSVNFYDVLGVSPDADKATIEKAFRAISITTHPDKANAATRPKSGVESPDEQRAREQKNHDRYVQIVEARNTLVDDKKRKAYNSKHGIGADNDRHTSRRESGSESKSKSSSKSGAGDSPNDLIAIHQSSLEFQLSSIDYLNQRIRDLLYTLESLSRQSSRYLETTSLLEDILRKSRTAKDEIKKAMQDLEALSRRSLRDSEKRTRARELYHSVIDGPLEYLQRAETMVDELTSTIEQSRRR